MKKLSFSALILYGCFMLSTALHAQQRGKSVNFFEERTGSAVLRGMVSQKMEKCLQGRIIPADIERLVRPFAQRPEKDFSDWRCEYWGKWTSSSVMAASYYQSGEVNSLVRQACHALMKTQTDEGYIGTYSKDMQLNGWDIWGRKYVLLGLIQYYDVSKDMSALSAATKQLDYIIRQVGNTGGRKRITDIGLDVLQGLPASSVLEPVCLLYQRTGRKEYYDFAAYIVSEWSKPSIFNSTGIKLVEHGSMGTAPAAIAASKAYELMSCYEGLCEWYRITGDKKYLNAVVGFAKAIINHEITITGSGSEQELWANTKRTQTGLIQEPMETCVTVTWMKLCYQLLQLTGENTWADQMETSLYNALLGAMTTDGKWWSYFSPLEGERIPSQSQHADMHLSCCVANGPRGLFLTPRWSLMKSKKGIVLNLPEDGSYSEKINDEDFTLNISGAYPKGGTVLIETGASKQQVQLMIRIPAWSMNTVATLNGKPMAVSPEAYLTINRAWKKGDKVEIIFDMRGRLIPAPSGAPFLAVARGPVVLALDNRFQRPTDDVFSFFTSRTPLFPANSDSSTYKYIGPYPVPGPGETEFVKLTEVPANDSAWMVFDLPVLSRPSHYFNHHTGSIRMIDYASAGNAFSSHNLLRVWLPVPMYLKDVYRSDLWKLPHGGQKARPVIPEKW